MNPKPVILLASDVGESLPTAGDASRGVLAITRDTATDDIVSIGLLNASGDVEWVPVVTGTGDFVEITGDTMTGGLNIQGNHNSPPALLIEKADGTDLFKFYSNLAQGTFRTLAASDFQMYSTAETTQCFAIDGATGNIQRLGIVDVTISAGSATPEGALTAPIGSLYLRTGGGANTSVYRKESGAGNTGWVAISSDFAATGHSHAAENPRFNPQPCRFPHGNIQDPAAAATSFVSNSTYAAYMGRADAAYTSVSLRVQVDTGAGTITWAEVGIGTSPVITLSGGASITRRGSTDVAATYNTTGDKTTAVTTTGITYGDHLWALFGSQATTPYQLRAVAAESLDAGTDQSVAATRISTMSSPTAFGISAVRLGCGFWIGT